MAGYGRKCILAVDDAAFTLSRITDALGKHYEMITVNSGARALKYLNKNKPDLILLDIRMPGKDGFEILREIRSMEDRADIPIIMLTAMEDRHSVMRGIELGICDYVLKPFAPDDLLERVQRILKPKKAGAGGYNSEGAQLDASEGAESARADGGESGPADAGGQGAESAQPDASEGAQLDAVGQGAESARADGGESGPAGAGGQGAESARADSSENGQAGAVESGPGSAVEGGL